MFASGYKETIDENAHKLTADKQFKFKKMTDDEKRRYRSTLAKEYKIPEHEVQIITEPDDSIAIYIKGVKISSLETKYIPHDW